MPTKDEIVAKARELYGTDDVEIDDDAHVSEGADDGTWVAAWVWVSDVEFKYGNATN